MITNEKLQEIFNHFVTFNHALGDVAVELVNSGYNFDPRLHHIAQHMEQVQNDVECVAKVMRLLVTEAMAKLN